MMETNLRLKRSGIKQLLALILLVTSISATAQEAAIELLTEIPDWETVAMDPRGQFYVATRDADILKISKQGQETIRYSGRTRSATTILDAQQELRIFVFQEPSQRVFFLDQFLQEYGQIDLSMLDAGYVALAAPSSENGLWIFSNEDYSLQKINLPSQQQMVRNDLSQLINESTGEPIALKEYQNRVYLQLEGGLLVEFDNIGNLIRKRTLPPDALPGFAPGEMIYADQKNIVIQSLDQDHRKSIPVPGDIMPEKVFRRESDFYLITANAIYRLAN